MQHRHSREWRRALARALVMLIALSGSTLVAVPARADLAGTIVPSLVLSEDEQQLLADNPALQQLAIDAPDLLVEVFAIIRAARESGVTSRGSFDGLDDSQVRLLGQNPALLQVWRSSPEASADLLQLIRTAAGGGKTQK